MLSNDTFFRLNRFILLAGTLGCLIISLVETETQEVSVFQQPIMQVEQWVWGEDLEWGGGQSELIVVEQGNGSWNWVAVLFAFYLLGFIIHLILIFLSLRRLRAVVKDGKEQPRGKYRIVRIPYPIAPFSWGKYIVLSEEDFLSNPHEILEHEEQHLRLYHSVDLVWMECVLAVNWFNPVVRLLKRELQDIHEYQADAGVLSKGIDATKYQLLLVKKAVGASRYTLANSFNHSKIKKRITMMLKVQSNKWSRLKPLLLVPVGMIALHAFARPSEEIKEIIHSSERMSEEVFVSSAEDKSTTILPGNKEKPFEVFPWEQEKKVAPPPPTLPPGERRVMQVIFYYDKDEYKAFDLYENTTSQDVNVEVKRWWSEKVSRIRINTVSWLTEEQRKEYLTMLSEATPVTTREIDCEFKRGSIQ